MIAKKWIYALLFAGTMLLDRITKYLALTYCDSTEPTDSLVSWCLSLNRGISWGIFHSEGNALFLVVTTLTMAITLILAAYTVIRYTNHQPIFGEMLVLAGSCSNLVDRFLYGGVVDFILLSYGDWSFPIFNCADVCIILGVGLMIFEQYGEL